MYKKFNLGRINLCGTGKRYPVEVRVELRERGGEETFTVDPVTRERHYTGERCPEYVEFSAMALVGARMGGQCQCLDEINQHRRDFTRENRILWHKIYRLWQMYHLNDMHAGTPEQEQAIEEWKQAGHKYDYTEVCNMLKEKGLYEVPFTGKTVGRMYNGELYKYGHGWVVEDIPEEDIAIIRELLS